MYPYLLEMHPLSFQFFVLYYKSMKLKFIVLALLPLTFAACQSGDIQQAGDRTVATLQQKSANQLLSAYHWQLDRGLERPIVHYILCAIPLTLTIRPYRFPLPMVKNMN